MGSGSGEEGYFIFEPGLWPDEAAWKLRRGLDLLFAHDFHDQDMNRASGAWTRQRLAMEWTPQPGLALQPALGIREDSAPGLDKARQLQAEIQIHIFM